MHISHSMLCRRVPWSRRLFLSSIVFCFLLIAPRAERQAALRAANPANIPGNCNGDLLVNIADPIFLLGFLFSSSFTPTCPPRCDFSADGRLDVSDAIAMLNYVILGSAAPKPLVLPPEKCGDGIDNNCDGQIDEGCTPPPPPPDFKADLTWDAVTTDTKGAPDVVAGYRIYAGTASARYTSTVEVRDCNCTTLDKLKVGVAYFVAVTAFDTAGNEGPFSSEIKILKAAP